MVEICEVGPRDGLQNEAVTLSVSDRVQLINRLVEAGITKVEAVSFVNPKVVVQMAEPEEVMRQLNQAVGVRFAGLVLSAKGMERAMESDVDDIHLVLAASTAFNLKNARRTTDESLGELVPLVERAKTGHRGVTAVIGTAFGCPFEGKVSEEVVFYAAKRFLDAGADAITLADTTGMANPGQVRNMVEAFVEQFPDVPLGLHFHNTRGLGAANVYAGYLAGVRRFDASIGGLGGCPFAPLSVGNVCTEDVVHMFEQMGVDTGLNLDGLLAAARFAQEKVQHPVDSYVLRAGPVP
ncbi:hydroxymethylglutaryl-CoA lyase [Alicyclobacillus sp. SO9]|uniref:hydroxymethylglutaryl-CoA lyase n=1 Tax=Alicyclobacillus sp. SO9 TaxID=2665646 RepID=UPI0018E73BB8|nr:hydroxymethylglutaryl-CoA lyase [Alicyclobacillus sp. SO9]QQE80015.1 hydroxymethylglutaryl-CoA lyase [Alicyclobacillus sp. SO9]